jgi:Transcriptional regulator containing an amidase domain and an AraC-type DNA-binding HTH domain
MSKSTLHRRIKELTNLSPVLFIRNVRLKHAHGLLLNTSDTITNIASAVGYEDPKYFSKCFREMYGKPPREYRLEKTDTIQIS